MFALSLLAISLCLPHALAIPAHEQKNFEEPIPVPGPIGRCNKFHSPTLVGMPDANRLQELLNPLEPSIIAYVNSSCGPPIDRYFDALRNTGLWFPVYVVNCDNSSISHMCPVSTCPEASNEVVDKLPNVWVSPWQLEVELESNATLSTGEEILESIAECLPNYIDQISSVNEWIEKYGSIHRVLVETEDGELPRTWNVLASRFLGRARFGVVNNKNANLIQESGLERGPIPKWKVRIYQAKTKMVITYFRDIDFAMIANIVDGLVPPQPMSVWRKIGRKLKQFWSVIWRVY
ncbi:hypothetical protein F5887DRAFT_996659 [Amanita rubescens]|nr:hypothetical protein F5887DRAFT_996659 [Amanita rubescens]